ncbi:DUF192 domain-containing protein [Patescibacteria group bacterium]|nr:DUF192 domain-containing protein [Patescibacteria group bacterium]MBU1757837.1 DUF192 domain-containing protein [Patescibacteria group bacterium]
MIEDGEENTFVYAQNVIKNRGILFEFPQPGVYSLGLRNVDMPLDIVWLDEEYIIVYIKHDTQPCSADPCPAFSSPFTAKYILEINGGIVEGKKFKI